MNILEQPSQSNIHLSTTHEISSINRKPVTTMTLPNEESAFIITSAGGHSAIEDSSNKFVFNTRALEAEDLNETS
jgi:hypothetical protein